MNPVTRSEILDYATYEDKRPSFRADILKIKAPRRVHLADCLTLLFENHDTVLYQIQEMMRAERIVRESAIVHEIETYNELLGKEGELGCTLLIEIEDPVERERKLKEWRLLPEKLSVVLEDGSRIPASFDERQRGDDVLSSVQYLKFDTRRSVPVAVRVDLTGLTAEARLTPEQREALRADLS
jgi:Protein of unknown function (DUF3501)